MEGYKIAEGVTHPKLRFVLVGGLKGIGDPLGLEDQVSP